MSGRGEPSIIWLILILALIYILSPVDVIPDVIPVVGYVDDAVVAVGAGGAYWLAAKK